MSSQKVLKNRGDEKHASQITRYIAKIINPARHQAGFIGRLKATLPVSSLRCFERIKFRVLGRRGFGNMGCKIAASRLPFQGRIRT
jgi:hypothetical protein